MRRDEQEHESSGRRRPVPHGGGHGSHGGGGHEEGHEGAPEWLISFADNTALMMGFFVIMLALTMAMKPQGAATAANTSDETQPSQAAAASGQSVEQLDFALGVRAGFHNPVTLNSDRPGDQYLVMRLREKLAGENQAIDENVPGKSDLARSLDRGLMEFKVALVRFKEDSSDPDEDVAAQLDGFARRARGLRQIVEVRGHVSSHEASGGGDRAMRLSYERAEKMARELVGRGVAWTRMRIVAVGDAEPSILRAYDRDQRIHNARVEMTLTDAVEGE